MNKKNIFLKSFVYVALLLIVMGSIAIFYDKYANLSLSSFLILSMIILFISFSGLAIYVYYQKQIVPVEEIAQVVRAVRNGDLSKRVNIKAKGRISQLGININKMICSLIEYQKELHKQKEYLEALFNSLADGVMVINSECRITDINPMVEIWIGLKEEEIIGKKLSEFLKCKCPVEGQNFENCADICPLISQNERLLPTEAQILNINKGIEKSLGLNCAQVADFVTQPTYVIVLRDITDIKEMESLKEDFIATLTHDLRVPILAEANTLKFFSKGMFGDITEKQKEAIDNMIESNSGLLSLVNSLLDIYKYDSGRAELLKENINIKKLIKDCVNELAPIAAKNKQTIRNLSSYDIPLVSIDKNEIKRVLINLINNSIAYTPKDGLITIDVENKTNEIIIKVSDNGKGIPESELEIIFERFFSKAKKFRKVGTGLGLYLSRQIIEKHDGKIWAESSLGKGSIFYVSLPLNT